MKIGVYSHCTIDSIVSGDSTYETAGGPACYCSLTARNQRFDVNLVTKYGKDFPLSQFLEKNKIKMQDPLSSENTTRFKIVLNDSDRDLIIENKYLIADQYIQVCKKYGWEYIKLKKDGQQPNLYKFILISREENPEKEFAQITKRTSPVYDYILGRDNDEIIKRHICLPVWYMLENKALSEVIQELKR